MPKRVIKLACILFFFYAGAARANLHPIDIPLPTSWHNLSTNWSGMDTNPDMPCRGHIVGKHNNMLIYLGTSKKPARQQNHAADCATTSSKSSSYSIWTASLTFSPEHSLDGAILEWRKNDLHLPTGFKVSVSVSHTYGVIVLGARSETGATLEAYLLSWDSKRGSVVPHTLPSLHALTHATSAALVDSALYVTGNSGASPQIMRLDLDRIKLDQAGNPAASEQTISFRSGGGNWEPLKLPYSLKPTNTFLNASSQDDGFGQKLYLLLADQLDEETKSNRYTLESLWSFDPNRTDSASAWKKRNFPEWLPKKVSGRQLIAAMALGQSHFLYFTHPTGHALSYNSVTDSWTSYSLRDWKGVFERAAHISPLTATSGLVSGMSSNSSMPQMLAFNIESRPTSFGPVNMGVLSVYLLAMVLVGFWFSKRNQSTDDYFRGGQHIPWWAAACSIYATMLSSLTYIALPALVFQTDWRLYLGIAMLAVVAPFAIYIAMPFFRQINATSAYEYLSLRFNMATRLFASGMFALFHLGRMGIVLALTALALAAVTQLTPLQCVLVMGVLSLIYSTIGGVGAVVWTDTIQTIVLIIGAVICFAFIMAGIEGGFDGFLRAGQSAEKFKMIHVDFGPTSATTLSLWVIVLGGIGQNISSYTSDQAIVQRYMVTKDAGAAKRSIAANAIIAIPATLIFFGIGTGLYAFYQSQPHRLDPALKIDQIFPAFIATELPVGIAGLIVAGIFAAAQSTVSTSMNSIATTIVTDFLRPFNVCRSEKSYLQTAKALTFSAGLLGTATGLVFIDPNVRSLMNEYFKVIGMFMGALGGVFLLGILTKRATATGALFGITMGVICMITTWQKAWADGYLFAAIGISTCLISGYLASIIFPGREKDLSGLTLHTKHSQ